MVMEVTKETTKSEAYADDLTAAGSLIGVKEWYGTISAELVLYLITSLERRNAGLM